jgi:nitrilase
MSRSEREYALVGRPRFLAPAQCGEHPGGRLTYGRSMVVDPWGLVIARAPDRPGPVLAECHLEELERVRASLPALRHRRL